MDYRKLKYAVIILFSSILIVYFSGKLNLYIHPRYLSFTTIFIVLGLALLMIDLIISNKKETFSKSGYIVVAIALISLFIPPQSLTAELASNRVDGSQKSNSYINNPTTYESFSRDLTRFGIQDWVGYLSTSPTEDQVAGASANLTGFITKDESNQLYIARFKLTCCAVDASPLTVPLLGTEDSKLLQIGSWYNLKGNFVYLDDLDNKFQLEINESEEISEPEDPYVY